VKFVQDYRKRFFDSTNMGAPGHDQNDLKFYVPNRVSIERRAAENFVDSPRMQNTTSDSEKENSEKTRRQADENPEMPDTISPQHAYTSLTQHAINVPFSLPAIQTTSGDNSLDLSQFASFRESPPFKAECMRIVATFLRPDSPKELSLDAMIREMIIRDLETSTHPDVVSYCFCPKLCVGSWVFFSTSSCMHIGKHMICLRRPVCPGSLRMPLSMSIYRSKYTS
jgi:hypothetical protein